MLVEVVIGRIKKLNEMYYGPLVEEVRLLFRKKTKKG